MEFLIGTEQATTSLSYYQTESITVFSCCTGANNESYVNISPKGNPTTGGENSIIDPMKNTTAFNQANDPCDNVTRYQQTTSGISDFSRTFFDNNLSGDELIVASTTFHLSEFGCTPVVLIHSSERGLLNFVQQQGWLYILCGATSTPVL